MPEISRFYGISIKMYYADHAPPHFHAYYGGSEALIQIDSPQLLAGRIPTRAANLVLEWATQHQGDLTRAWDQARRMEKSTQLTRCHNRCKPRFILV